MENAVALKIEELAHQIADENDVEAAWEMRGVADRVAALDMSEAESRALFEDSRRAAGPCYRYYTKGLNVSETVVRLVASIGGGK